MKYPYPKQTEGPRTTGRGVVLKDDRILLIERWRDGQHYFSIPGGGQDPGETAEQTAIREIHEETTIKVEAERLLYEMHDRGGNRHFIYLCKYVSGEPHLPPESEEAQAGPDNRFKPSWVAVEELSGLKFNYWRPIHKLLVDDLKNGFGKNVKVTTDE